MGQFVHPESAAHSGRGEIRVNPRVPEGGFSFRLARGGPNVALASSQRLVRSLGRQRIGTAARVKVASEPVG